MGKAVRGSAKNQPVSRNGAVPAFVDRIAVSAGLAREPRLPRARRPLRSPGPAAGLESADAMWRGQFQGLLRQAYRFSVAPGDRSPGRRKAVRWQSYG